MSPERWQQIEELYHAALELDPSARDGFLSQSCAGDKELRGEVESLLASHEDSGSFIESSPDDVVAGMIAEEAPQSIIGRTLGHYQLLSLLGAGGMGEVYRAHDTSLDRDVAVKILPEHLAQDAEALRRFEREAKAVAALSNPNILAIYDFGTQDGISYAVMELLEGETLRDCLRREPMGWRKTVEIGIVIAEGFEEATVRAMAISARSGAATEGGYGRRREDANIARTKAPGKAVSYDCRSSGIDFVTVAFQINWRGTEAIGKTIHQQC